MSSPLQMLPAAWSRSSGTTYARLWQGFMTARVILALAIVALQVLAYAMGQSSSQLFLGLCTGYLVATLLITLMLRTQMVQNSFESNTVQKNINMLTQDVQDDQAKLDELISSLPDKAQKMGMVPQQDSVTIDLNGYKPSKGSAQ